MRNCLSIMIRKDLSTRKAFDLEDSKKVHVPLLKLSTIVIEYMKLS